MCTQRLSGLFQNRGFGQLFGKFRIGKFLVELVNTACRVHKFHFTGKKRVAVSRNIHFHQWVFVAIFPSHLFFGGGAGFTKERFVRGDVFEYHGAIRGRMNVFFHDYCTKNLL